ncbi:MAG TPA: DNA-directed RNA polymerase subunit alpha [Lentisphaeria bacterium]|nr:MAG: DNA-directed RNA polymerase subunit alpha [Lentisphaerae bacterium GWF2_38_69]HBM15509.1 DNA-directed RNA polymerase subunit alpha [Lentisphaeria bacterium]
MGLVHDFPIPQSIEKDEVTATPTYAKFTAAPFQSGFGHTIGNSLRRVLLSSLKGAAISAIRIDGVTHEFATISKVVEDVSEIVLNLKKVLLVPHTDLPKTLEIRKKTAGPITAADIVTDGTVDIVNPELVICNLDKDTNFRVEIDITEGRGFRASEKNKNENQPIGTIAIDSNFSPVRRVRYQVGAARVGEETEMDSLIIEIWTDGRITPDDALEKAAKILRDHLRPFFGQSENLEPSALLSDEEKPLFKQVSQNVEILNLSVRSQNCLNNANIKLIGELCSKTEGRMLKYKNFGKKSLDEIVSKLAPMGLSLGMTFSENLTEAIRMEASKIELKPVIEQEDDEEEENEEKE